MLAMRRLSIIPLVVGVLVGIITIKLKKYVKDIGIDMGEGLVQNKVLSRGQLGFRDWYLNVECLPR